MPIPTSLFDFTPEEERYCEKIGEPDLLDKLIPAWYMPIAQKKKDEERKEQEDKMRSMGINPADKQKR